SYADEPPAAAVLLLRRANLHHGPRVAVGLQVPVRPARIDRRAPAPLQQVGGEQADEFGPIDAVLAPVGERPGAAEQGTLPPRPRGRRAGRRRAVGEQARAVAAPGADERLRVAE